MPDDKVDKETDGNPNTEYEDTEAHPRLGFRVDDKTRDRKYEQPNEESDRIDI
jgi:hypothetical protein